MIFRVPIVVKGSDKDTHTIPFAYVYEKTHTPVTNDRILKRIRKLHIPPGYKDVVISSSEKDKVQAYGFDTKGRKQTIYAKWFIEKQNREKFDRVMKLEKTMNLLKAHIDRTLKQYISLQNGHPTISQIRKMEMCMIVKLMMLCNFRIGSAANATKYKSYGLTTIEWRHVKINKGAGDAVRFSFIGKKGVLNEATCQDRKVYKILSKMHDSVYKDSSNSNREINRIRERDHERVFMVSSSDVNSYLQSFDKNITSKDIRTWQANVLFVKYFLENSDHAKTNEKRQTHALKKVAADLHNTPNVCKKSYIYPEFLKASLSNGE